MQRLGIDIGGSSVKVCLQTGLDPRIGSYTTRSDGYTHPTRDELALRIKQAIDRLPVGVERSACVGLCLPGKRASGNDSIERAVNLPCLDGWGFDDLLASSIGWIPKNRTVLSDVLAAGIDYLDHHASQGRTAVIAIGTGVGLCVFDDGRPVGIGNQGIGHLGMMDMGRIGASDRIASDGACNTLESYIGARATEQRFPGVDVQGLPGEIQRLAFDEPIDEPIILALVRAIRIVHAIYCPQRVVLMGGIGIALEPRHDPLFSTINHGLTTLVGSGWTLGFGDSPYHAARGAASSAD